MITQPQEVTEEKTLDQPPLTSQAAQNYPANRTSTGGDESPAGDAGGAIKPGHWTTVGFSLRSNQDDRRGTVRMTAESVQPTSVFIEEEAWTEGAVEAEKSITTERPTVLPKGQMRRFDTRLLTPMRSGRTVETIKLDGEFVSTDSATRSFLRPSGLIALAPETYFFVVLSDRPERFTRLQTADWVRPYQHEASLAPTHPNYRIVVPPTDGLMPIAETALDWTSTAVLFWDDVPTRALTQSQITAVLDWLHFGGTMIVNGPAATDSLNDPRFKEIFAIENDGIEELGWEAVDQFLKSLSVATDRSIDDINQSLRDGSTEIALAGKIRPGSIEIGDGGLLAERRVGRGRLVHSRVDLLSRWITSWDSYDSFFNSAILARPGRKFEIDRDAVLLQGRIDESVTSQSPGLGSQTSDVSPSDPAETNTEEPSTESILPPLRHTLLGLPAQRVHPAINTPVRFLSRDSTLVRQDENGLEVQESDEPIADATPGKAVMSSWITPQLWTHPVSGLGGWKDDSPVVAWGRTTLGGEIGLTIPDSKLVLRSLLLYFVVLVPVNYLIFRLIGRLEWAWLAVLPIAILGAILVARAAQLDVGFARSRNEIAVLEIPKDYDRGHLTRVLGVYNSLASTYRFDFDHPDAAISLIKSSSNDDRNAGLFGGKDPELRFGYEAGPMMDGVTVGSNSYQSLHIEQLVDIGGSIGSVDAPDEKPSTTPGGDLVPEQDRSNGEWFPQSGEIINRSRFDLRDVHLIDRADGKRVSIASLGDLPAGGRKAYQLKTNGDPSFANTIPMNLSDIMTRMMSWSNVEVQSTRLVGRIEGLIDEPIGGLTITPECRQVRSQTVVVVHLRYRDRADVTSDSNLVTDFKK